MSAMKPPSGSRRFRIRSASRLRDATARVDAALSRMRPFTVTVLGSILVLLFGILDELAGPHIPLSVFLILPVFLVTWYAGGRAGIVLSGLASMIWFDVDRVTLQHDVSPLVAGWNFLTKLGFFFTNTFILHRLRQTLRLEAELARTDALTGVANKRAFEEAASREIQRAARNTRPITVVYLDCDNFKQLNDTQGHDAGDLVLRTVAAVCLKTLRSMDLVARMGGDEFVLLLPELSPEDGMALLTRVQAALREALVQLGSGVTVSMGAVCFLVPPVDVDHMVTQVDARMYRVKNSGKDGVLLEVQGAPG